MKKLSLLFLTIVFVISANAQITITNNNAYLLGDQITYYKLFDIDQTWSPGVAGADVVWDFSSQTEDGTAETYEYISPAGLPHIAVMPSADLAEQLNSQTNGYFYFDNNGGTEWNRSGWYTNDGTNEIWMHYKEQTTWAPKPLSLYPYPFTYSDNLSVPFWGSGGFTGTDSINTTNGVYNFNCDGYGTLILPHKIYPNALRVHITESFTLDIYLYGTPFMQSVIEDDSYYWFVEGVKGPVMTYIHSTTDGANDSYNAKWYREILSAIVTDFTVNSQTGNTDDIFTFTNLSEPLDQGSTFLWQFTPSTVTFEGGTDANSVHPQVRFNEPGLYTASLTTINANFTPNSVTETKINYMDIAAAPQLAADFTVSNQNPNINAAVDFTNLTNPDASGGTTYTWAVSPGVNGTHWGFTNFTSSTDENPQITFYQSGCYSIQMVATNSSFSNSPVTVTKTNYINAGGGCGAAYTITFTVTDGSNPVNGAEITVTGSSPITTNSSGIATIDLYNGNYNYNITASSYDNYAGSFTVSDSNLPVNVTMTASVGIKTLTKNNINVYPNPTSGILNINSDKPMLITIYDISGKQIYVSKQSNKSFEIDLSKNSKGLYFINIIKNNQVFTEKVILK